MEYNLDRFRLRESFVDRNFLYSLRVQRAMEEESDYQSNSFLFYAQICSSIALGICRAFKRGLERMLKI